jgi:thiosulfate/3-mercaptopyruvate sulfurtransferase
LGCTFEVAAEIFKPAKPDGKSCDPPFVWKGDQRLAPNTWGMIAFREKGERVMKEFFFIFFGCTFMIILPAGLAQAGRIADTEEVAKTVTRGAILWDVREGPAYTKGHIPGAVNVGSKICTILRTPGTWDYVPIQRINQWLANWGIDPAKEIVVYGDKASVCPYFVLVTLEFVGAQNVKVYHGGIDDWASANRPLSTTPAVIMPLALRLRVKPDVIVSTDEVIRSLKRNDVQILDVRTPKEYSGEDVRALGGGHIPGAMNLPYEMNWVDPQALFKMETESWAARKGLALKTPEQLKEVYAKLDLQKETLVYCQTSPRAWVTATVLKDLGFQRVRVYDSSWLGYGNRFDAPAENETFFDVFALTRRLAMMEKRINALEKELARIKEQREPLGRETFPLERRIGQ